MLKHSTLIIIMALFFLPLISSAQFSGGDGSENDPYIISTAQQLAQLATYINAGTVPYANNGMHYKLANDINLSTYGDNFDQGQGWTPIGNSNKPFKGIFDGNNKVVSNLYIKRVDIVGLFGQIAFFSVVKNLSVKNVNITAGTGNRNVVWVGGGGQNVIVGGVVGNSESSSTVSNCYTTGTITCSISGSLWVGGVVGLNSDNSTVTNCHSTATVSSTATVWSVAGGVVGKNFGKVTNSYSTGSVSVSTSGRNVISYAGGVVGENKNNTSSVANCYSTGVISSTTTSSSFAFAGGVTGNNDNVVTNCYSTGTIMASASASNSFSGGITGHSSGKISNCYSTAIVRSAVSSSDPSFSSYAGGIVGNSLNSVSNSAALNSSISCNGVTKYYGRVVGRIESGSLSNNIAFNNIINPDGGTKWIHPGASNLDGAAVTAETVNADGSFSGRFNSPAWTTENGKLPGFGKKNDMPKHLFFERSIRTFEPESDKPQKTEASDVGKNIPITNVKNNNTFAVIIANENYRREAKVEFALKDGETFRDYCIKTLGLPETNVHFVADATLNDIRTEIDWLSAVASAYLREASIIFYYAGHGIPDESTRSAYLLPVDGSALNVQTAYKLDDLYETFGLMPVRSVTVFLDACFSGAQRSGEMLAEARAVVINVAPGTPTGNMIVFSAATGNQTAFSHREKGHGMFTYFLLKKLQETKGDVTLGELASYIETNVKQQSIVINKKSQTPTVTPAVAISEKWKGMKLK